MLVEAGFVRAVDSDGREWTFRPSLGRIASLGTPHEIVAIYAGLHGPKAATEAAYVLACLCDQEDASPLIGHIAEGGEWVAGLMPPDEQVIIARHLMQHGIVGKASPGKGGGKYSDRFDASEYISAARVHLRLSSADAEALSMTEFQTMFEMKYPEQSGKGKERDVPSRDEYRERIRKMEAKHGGQGR
ncbi:DUF6246 family protein [Roseateles sp.]|uniref:DUF6246 family protein n=1 Tax=Roseateles sp. TaxID=1971397 RepID=UPI0031D1BC55